MKRRRLTKDEDVHHKDGDKLNPCPLCNLEVLGHKEHGYVSAAQHQFMLRKDEHDLKIWQEIHGPTSTPERNPNAGADKEQPESQACQETPNPQPRDSGSTGNSIGT